MMKKLKDRFDALPGEEKLEFIRYIMPEMLDKLSSQEMMQWIKPYYTEIMKNIFRVNSTGIIKAKIDSKLGLCINDNNEHSDLVPYDLNMKSEKEFEELQSLYEFAIDTIKIRLYISVKQFQYEFHRNPIHCFESRVKTPLSILNKLKRRGLETSITAAKAYLNDIAGVRVICYYLDDVYLIENFICSQNDIQLIKKTDYIKTPKSNGYRSLHIVVKLPVLLSDVKEYVPIEIQIRTIAMDFWASLEHQIYYKCGCNNAPDELVKRLKDSADIIADMDIEMQNIGKELVESCMKKSIQL